MHRRAGDGEQLLPAVGPCDEGDGLVAERVEELPGQTGIGPIQMILFAPLSQMISAVLLPLLPGDSRFIAVWLPSLYQGTLAGTDVRQFALVWAGAALLLAARPLVLLLMHRELPAPRATSVKKR